MATTKLGLPNKFIALQFVAQITSVQSFASNPFHFHIYWLRVKPPNFPLLLYLSKPCTIFHHFPDIFGTLLLNIFIISEHHSQASLLISSIFMSSSLLKAGSISSSSQHFPSPPLITNIPCYLTSTMPLLPSLLQILCSCLFPFKSVFLLHVLLLKLPSLSFSLKTMTY